jgi:hypothetical protein
MGGKSKSTSTSALAFHLSWVPTLSAFCEGWLLGSPGRRSAVLQAGIWVSPPQKSCYSKRSPRGEESLLDLSPCNPIERPVSRIPSTIPIKKFVIPKEVRVAAGLQTRRSWVPLGWLPGFPSQNPPRHSERSPQGEESLFDQSVSSTHDRRVPHRLPSSGFRFHTPHNRSHPRGTAITRPAPFHTSI